MLGLESPLWLLGLFIIPLVWWIHRFRNQGIDQPVSSLVFWQKISHSENTGPNLTTVDPLWLQRAAIILTIVTALTSPVSDSLYNRKVDVWFDHSLSMLTAEAEGTRLERGIQQLLDRLKAEEVTQATIHSLQNSSYSLQLDLHTAAQNKHELQTWLDTASQTSSKSLPIPTTLNHETWLVTDGADTRLQNWVYKTNISRVIQVGSATENTALTLLSVRPSLAQTGFTGIANILNQGQRAATRRLQIRTQDKILNEWSFTLQPGETKHHSFNMPLNDTGLIEARLLQMEGTTKELLTKDDSLSISIPTTQIEVTGNCGKPIQALMQALPGIRLSSSASADLTIVCSDKPPVVNNTAIWFYTGGETQQVTSLPFWEPSAEQLSQLSLQPTQLLAHTTQTPILGQILLTADGMPLISYQSLPKRLLEVRLDIQTPQLTEHKIFPLMMTELMEFALEHKLLDRFHSVQQSPQEVQITPRLLQTNSNNSKGNHIKALGLAHWLIIIAIVLLLLDTARNKRMPV